MIKFEYSDFFDSLINPDKHPTEAYVNPVNCVGVMGKGLALRFKELFPKNFEAYRKVYEKHKLRIGECVVCKDSAFGREVIIINFPTKVHWKNPSQYQFIEKGLIWLRDYIIKNKIKTITIPKLGCGLGGLDFGDEKYARETVDTETDSVYGLMKKYLDDLECDVTCVI